MREQFGEVKDVLLQVDAEILKAYNLPPHLEHELLNTFQDIERPIPFEFTGYYPQGFDAHLPLHELISESFERARADRLIERLDFVDDSEISKMLTSLRGESADEGLSS
jgi:hypothetical protein